MFQVYCNGEEGVNNWLRENQDIEVIDIKITMNNEGELIMVVYKINGCL